METTDVEMREAEGMAAKWWWMWLVTGILWVVISLSILQFRGSSITTVGIIIGLMFLLMVRVTDPLVPRATFGLLNTLLYFPSGAVYPQQGFPAWMQVIAVADPFTYAVHALKCLLLKNTGFGAIGSDLLFLTLFSALAMTLATRLFKRTL
jgi:ABC-2 type transport system permease protein